jgi:hypothetical protein
VDQAAYVYRIAVGASDGEAASVLMALGGVPQAAAGRVTGGSPGGAAVFRIDTQGLLRTPDLATELLVMSRDDQSQLIGEGWSAVDWDEVSPYRWMTRTDARLLLPVAGPNARRVRIQALLEPGGAPTRIGLRVNGIDLPQQGLRAGWDAYEWTLPDAMAPRLATDVVVTVDRLSPAVGTSPARGVAVTDVRVLHGR